MSHKVLDYFGITLGAAVSALGTQAFIVVVKLGGGGIGGLAILAHYLWAWHIGLVVAILNIPLLIFGWREIGQGFVIRTTFGVFMNSLFLEVFRSVNFVPNHDVLLGALFGGVVQGIGGALVFRFEGSLGGTDIIAKTLNRRYGFRIGNVGFIANIFVVSLSLVVLGPVTAMYTLVSMYVYSKVLDAIVEGIPAKSAMIISAYGDVLAKKIIAESSRGVTLLQGRGAYTGEQKDILVCVVAVSELVRLKRMVKQIDPEAFVIVNDAKEVLGKGFAQLA